MKQLNMKMRDYRQAEAVRNEAEVGYVIPNANET